MTRRTSPRATAVATVLLLTAPLRAPAFAKGGELPANGDAFFLTDAADSTRAETTFTSSSRRRPRSPAP